MEQKRLSQEEIEELLKQAQREGVAEVSGRREPLESEERETLLKLEAIFADKVAEVLSTLIKEQVSVTDLTLDPFDLEKLKEDFPPPCICISMLFEQGASGGICLLLSGELGARLADWATGGDGDGLPPQERHLDTLEKVMDRAMGVVADEWSSVLGRKVKFSASRGTLIDLGERDWEGSRQLLINFNLGVGEELSSRMVQLMPLDVMWELLRATHTEREEPSSIQGEGPEGHQVVAQPAQFEPLGPSPEPEKAGVEPSKLDLILDLTLPVTVELGRTKMLIKNILELGPGSIIELDKLAGEPVDLLINGRKFAEGEVVVIDENFGVRITNLISLVDRIKNLDQM